MNYDSAMMSGAMIFLLEGKALESSMQSISVNVFRLSLKRFMNQLKEY